MGLEEIVGRINDDAERQAAALDATANAEAAKTLAEAKEKAASILTHARTQAGRQVKEERLRSVASARLAAKRELMQAREDVLRRYEEGVTKSLDEFVKTEEYAKFLAKAEEDGVAKIGGAAVVRVNARDRALLRGRKLGGELSKEPMECKGGALVLSEDGKRRVDNTIESLFRERSDVIRLKLLGQVFGDGQKDTP